MYSLPQANYHFNFVVLSLVRTILSSLYFSSLLALLSIPSICVHLHLFSSPHSKSTHLLHISLFTQGSCDPYSHVIIGPILLPLYQSCFHLIPSRFLCQRALQNLQILFSPIVFAFPRIPRCSTSPLLPVFFSSQGILILIILSPLSHPSSPL